MDEDVENAIARRKRFSKIWLIVFIGLMRFVSAALIFGRKDLRAGDYVGMAGLVGAALLTRSIMINEFDQALKYKEKRVIRGVITVSRWLKETKRGDAMLNSA